MKDNKSRRVPKSVPMNVRVPYELYEEISHEAEAKGCSLSEEVVRRLRNSRNGLTPEIPVMVQNIINYAVCIARDVYPDACKEIEEMGMKLWKYLK